MFSHIKVELGNDYHIVATREAHIVSIQINFNQIVVGEARILTDHADVECILSIVMVDEHINKILIRNHTLGEILIKFLMKFPALVRKPEFIFIYNPPENFKSILEKYHFISNINPEYGIMIRSNKVFPKQDKTNNDLVFKSSIECDQMNALLFLLQKNAYWQSHLTMDRLNLLINNSRCFCVLDLNNSIIGFARVLTDNISFASLWDVVIDDNFRGKGIGIALMHHIFSDVELSKIENWILFTDSARALYEKFGFVSESKIHNQNIAFKIRFQDSQPEYMGKLIHAITNGLPAVLNLEQATEFLYGDSGKRSQLSNFWKKIHEPETLDRDEIDQNSTLFKP